MFKVRFHTLYQVLSFPLTHWRGQVALAPTLLFTLLGLRFTIAGYGGLRFAGLDIALFVWQVVGSWRALSRYQRNTPDFLVLFAGCVAILASVPALAWPQLDRIAQKNLPPVTVPDLGPTGIAVTPGQVNLAGIIDFVMFDAFKQAISGDQNVKRVVLDSHGGRIFAARAIAKLVRENSLSTHVDGTCASACTLIYIAGTRRSLGAEGRLGFHGYSNESQVQVVSPSEEEAKDRATFLSHGVDPSFVSKMFHASPHDMWFPSRKELLDAGVVTQP